MRRYEEFRTQVQRRLLLGSVVHYNFPTAISDELMPKYGCTDISNLSSLNFLADFDNESFDRIVQHEDLNANNNTIRIDRFSPYVEQFAAKGFDFVCDQIIHGAKWKKWTLDTFPKHKFPLSIRSAVDLLRSIDNTPELLISDALSSLTKDESCLLNAIRTMVLRSTSDKSNYVKMILEVDSRVVALAYTKSIRRFCSFYSNCTNVGAQLSICALENLPSLADWLKTSIFGRGSLQRTNVYVLRKNRIQAYSLKVSKEAAPLFTSDKLKSDSCSGEETDSDWDFCEDFTKSANLDCFQSSDDSEWEMVDSDLSSWSLCDDE